jgi:hypothetical protein
MRNSEGAYPRARAHSLTMGEKSATIGVLLIHAEMAKDTKLRRRSPVRTPAGRPGISISLPLYIVQNTCIPKQMNDWVHGMNLVNHTRDEKNFETAGQCWLSEERHACVRRESKEE